MKLLEFLGGEATDEGMRFALSRDLYGAFEGTFGGVVAACSLAAARTKAEGLRPVSLDCRFMRSLEAGDVEARVEIIRAGRTMSFLEVRITDERGRLAATATAGLANGDALHPLDDEAMVRPGASVDYAEASPFQLRREDAPIVGTLEPRVALTDPGLLATVLEVPWDEPGTGPEAACLAADMSVGPPVARELASSWVPHPNPDLSLRFVGHDVGTEVAGVARLERVGKGVAAVHIEVFSGIELVAIGISASLLLGVAPIRPS